MGPVWSLALHKLFIRIPRLSNDDSGLAPVLPCVWCVLPVLRVCVRSLADRLCAGLNAGAGFARSSPIAVTDWRSALEAHYQTLWTQVHLRLRAR